MFDEFEVLDDGALLAVMGDSLHAERAAAARRLVAAGVFAARHDAGPGSETERWCVEDFTAAAAEVGAELGLSRFRAEADMSCGLTLVQRLPRLAHRFLAGEVDPRVIAIVDHRTTLVQDPGVLAELDARLAEAAPRWNALSQAKLTEVVDWLVVQLDPEAKRVARDRRDDRHVEITPGEHGLSEIHGRLSAVDGAALDKRLDAIAATVCRDDPRTAAQRRVDGLMALSERRESLDCRCGQDQCPAGGETDAPRPTPAPAPTQVIVSLDCRCGQDQCPAGGETDAPRPTPAPAPTQVIVHVLAEQATVDGSGDTPAYLPGHGPVPAATIRELVDTGRATTRPLTIPSPDTPPEPGYRPSRALSAFLMFRDLTCRFPGCSHPAQKCDYDHTVPWPHGRTHPSDLKAYCRHHHLLKTFGTTPNTQTAQSSSLHPAAAATPRPHSVRGSSPGWPPRPASTAHAAHPHPTPTPRRGPCRYDDAAAPPTKPPASPRNARSTAPS
ncbi:HNH endonuclease signature motif containing protein [Mycolicibacterium arabiense]|uniref:HNH endonuclease signature motif containing protein n=1 Tax=Mycolicibacterium arabiense TaxID=1286181 RepID=UPI0021F319C2|nr:HNH endonuclease signature motif containing protein [Mycolicibacterium arabiense]